MKIYKCNVCGNIVELIHEGGGELVCCGQPMELLKEKNTDEGLEKHVPVVDEDKIKVGSIPHPMEDSHYIEWIEVSGCRKYLKPGDKPEIEFKEGDVRAYCNIHGLWRK
ncbi:MAG: desulfoferrodoxin [Patescibacteria group bacterium]